MEPHQETRSVGAEDTFPEDLSAIEDLHKELDKIALTVVERLKKYGLKGRTLTLKIKYHDFKQITRSKSFALGIDDLDTIGLVAKELLAVTQPEGL